MQPMVAYNTKNTATNVYSNGLSGNTTLFFLTVDNLTMSMEAAHIVFPRGTLTNVLVFR